MTLMDDVKTILGIDGSEYDSKLALFVPFAEGMLAGKGVVDTTSEKYKMAIAIIVSEKLDGKSDFSIDLDSIVLQLKYCYVAVPIGFYAIVKNGEVTLYWDANSESNLSGYKVYQDNVEITSIKTNSYLITGLASGTYSFKISAFDKNNNSSVLSDPIDVEVV